MTLDLPSTADVSACIEALFRRLTVRPVCVGACGCASPGVLVHNAKFLTHRLTTGLLRSTQKRMAALPLSTRPGAGVLPRSVGGGTTPRVAPTDRRPFQACEPASSLQAAASGPRLLRTPSSAAAGPGAGATVLVSAWYGATMKLPLRSRRMLRRSATSLATEVSQSCTRSAPEQESHARLQATCRARVGARGDERERRRGGERARTLGGGRG